MFDLQGHRGARGLFPENTIAGFRAAIARGYRSFEIDVGVTRDGVVVVHHDPALNPDLARGADGAWLDGQGPLLRELTLAELRRYDVGRIRPGPAYAARYPEQSAVDGSGIPTLAEVLEVGAGLRWNIELKVMPAHPEWTVAPEEMVELVLRVTDGVDAAVTIQSFDWRAPRHVRRVRPEVARGWLSAAATEADPALWWDRAPGPGTPEAIAEEGGGTWTPEHTTLTPEKLARGQALGLLVIPWTVNDPADMRRLRSWGVDGLITDYPDRFEL